MTVLAFPSAEAPTTAYGDADISSVAALLADRGRCRVLFALDDGRALPASVLAAEAGIAASTASGHLAKLVEGGLLTVTVHGRNRYYRLAGPHVAALLESLAAVAPATPVRSLRESTRAHALRAARSCYDHLAGRLGVEVTQALVRDGVLHVEGDPEAEPDPPVGHGRELSITLTERGLDRLAEFAIAAPPRSSARAVRYCIDWSEQRPHVAGWLGRALLSRMLDLDWLRRAERGRALRVTPAGRAGLAASFGVDWS
jgi:DNA-binding transcriptional ArsR family regulator